MIDRLVANVAPGETRIALLDGARVVEIHHHRVEQPGVVGNLYLGRVTGLHGGANGAFIDIGLARPGFLNAADARPNSHGPVVAISRQVDEGATVLVQVSRDALHDKGPRLTLRPGLVGRYVVFHPGQGGIEVSRRIANQVERVRLKQIMGTVATVGGGVTLRSAADGVDDDRIIKDMERLQRIWRTAIEAREGAKPPVCLWTAPEPLENVLMTYPGLRWVTVDDTAALAEVKRLMGDDDGVLEQHRSSEAVFESFSIEAAIEEAFGQRVALPSGGAVIIEETNAICAIDVDGGSALGPASSLRVNLEAAEVIARQLRLCAIGGIIVIDFLRMKKRDHCRRVIEAMTQALADDRDAVAPQGFSTLGLVEMRRRRTRPSLREIFGEEGGVRKNPITLALDIARAAVREMDHRSLGPVTIKVAEDVVAAFTPKLIAAIADAAGRSVTAAVDPAYQGGEWRIDSVQP